MMTIIIKIIVAQVVDSIVSLILSADHPLVERVGPNILETKCSANQNTFPKFEKKTAMIFLYIFGVRTALLKDPIYKDPISRAVRMSHDPRSGYLAPTSY